MRKFFARRKKKPETKNQSDLNLHSSSDGPAKATQSSNGAHPDRKDLIGCHENVKTDCTPKTQPQHQTLGDDSSSTIDEQLDPLMCMPTNVHPAYVPPRQGAPVPSRKAELTHRERHQEIVPNKTTETSFNIIETKDEGIQSCKAFTPMKQQRPINYEPFGEDHFDGITTVLNQQPGKVSHQLQYLDNSVSDGWQIEDLTDLQMNESNKQRKDLMGCHENVKTDCTPKTQPRHLAFGDDSSSINGQHLDPLMSMPTNVLPAPDPPRQGAPVPSRKSDRAHRPRQWEIWTNKNTEHTLNVIPTTNEGIQSCKDFIQMKQQLPINNEPLGEDGIPSVENQLPGKISHQLQNLDNGVSDGWQIEDLTVLQINESDKQIEGPSVLIPTVSNGQHFKESNIKFIKEPLSKLTQHLCLEETNALTNQDVVELDSIQIQIQNSHLFDTPILPVSQTRDQVGQSNINLSKPVDRSINDEQICKEFIQVAVPDNQSKLQTDSLATSTVCPTTILCDKCPSHLDPLIVITDPLLSHVSPDTKQTGPSSSRPCQSTTQIKPPTSLACDLTSSSSPWSTGPLLTLLGQVDQTTTLTNQFSRKDNFTTTQTKLHRDQMTHIPAINETERSPLRPILTSNQDESVESEFRVSPVGVCQTLSNPTSQICQLSPSTEQPLNQDEPVRMQPTQPVQLQSPNDQSVSSLQVISINQIVEDLCSETESGTQMGMLEGDNQDTRKKETKKAWKNKPGKQVCEKCLETAQDICHGVETTSENAQKESSNKKQSSPQVHKEKHKSQPVHKNKQASPVHKDNQTIPLVHKKKQKLPSTDTTEKQKTQLLHKEKQKSPSAHKEKQNSPLVHKEKQISPSVHKEKQKSTPIHNEKKTSLPVDKEKQKFTPVPKEKQASTSVQKEKQKSTSVHNEKQMLAPVHQKKQTSPPVHKKKGQKENFVEKTTVAKDIPYATENKDIKSVRNIDDTTEVGLNCRTESGKQLNRYEHSQILNNECNDCTSDMSVAKENASISSKAEQKSKNGTLSKETENLTKHKSKRSDPVGHFREEIKIKQQRVAGNIDAVKKNKAQERTLKCETVVAKKKKRKHSSLKANQKKEIRGANYEKEKASFMMKAYEFNENDFVQSLQDGKHLTNSKGGNDKLNGEKLKRNKDISEDKFRENPTENKNVLDSQKSKFKLKKNDPDTTLTYLEPIENGTLKGTINDTTIEKRTKRRNVSKKTKDQADVNLNAERKRTVVRRNQDHRDNKSLTVNGNGRTQDHAENQNGNITREDTKKSRRDKNMVTLDADIRQLPNNTTQTITLQDNQAFINNDVVNHDDKHTPQVSTINEKPEDNDCGEHKRFKGVLKSFRNKTSSFIKGIRKLPFVDSKKQKSEKSTQNNKISVISTVDSGTSNNQVTDENYENTYQTDLSKPIFAGMQTVGLQTKKSDANHQDPSALKKPVIVNAPKAKEESDRHVRHLSSANSNTNYKGLLHKQQHGKPEESKTAVKEKCTKRYITTSKTKIQKACASEKGKSRKEIQRPENPKRQGKEQNSYSGEKNPQTNVPSKAVSKQDRKLSHTTRSNDDFGLKRLFCGENNLEDKKGQTKQRRRKPENIRGQKKIQKACASEEGRFRKENQRSEKTRRQGKDQISYSGEKKTQINIPTKAVSRQDRKLSHTTRSDDDFGLKRLFCGENNLEDKKGQTKQRNRKPENIRGQKKIQKTCASEEDRFRKESQRSENTRRQGKDQISYSGEKKPQTNIPTKAVSRQDRKLSHTTRFNDYFGLKRLFCGKNNLEDIKRPFDKKGQTKHGRRKTENIKKQKKIQKACASEEGRFRKESQRSEKPRRRGKQQSLYSGEKKPQTNLPTKAVSQQDRKLSHTTRSNDDFGLKRLFCGENNLEDIKRPFDKKVQTKHGRRKTEDIRRQKKERLTSNSSQTNTRSKFNLRNDRKTSHKIKSKAKLDVLAADNICKQILFGREHDLKAYGHEEGINGFGIRHNRTVKKGRRRNKLNSKLTREVLQPARQRFRKPAQRRQKIQFKPTPRTFHRGRDANNIKHVMQKRIAGNKYRTQTQKPGNTLPKNRLRQGSTQFHQAKTNTKNHVSEANNTHIKKSKYKIVEKFVGKYEEWDFEDFVTQNPFENVSNNSRLSVSETRSCIFRAEKPFVDDKTNGLENNKNDISFSDNGNGNNLTLVHGPWSNDTGNDIDENDEKVEAGWETKTISTDDNDTGNDIDENDEKVEAGWETNDNSTNDNDTEKDIDENDGDVEAGWETDTISTDDNVTGNDIDENDEKFEAGWETDDNTSDDNDTGNDIDETDEKVEAGWKTGDSTTDDYDTENDIDENNEKFEAGWETDDNTTDDNDTGNEIDETDEKVEAGWETDDNSTNDNHTGINIDESDKKFEAGWEIGNNSTDDSNTGNDFDENDENVKAIWENDDIFTDDNGNDIDEIDENFKAGWETDKNSTDDNDTGNDIIENNKKMEAEWETDDNSTDDNDTENYIDKNDEQVETGWETDDNSTDDNDTGNLDENDEEVEAGWETDNYSTEDNHTGNDIDKNEKNVEAGWGTDDNSTDDNDTDKEGHEKDDEFVDKGYIENDIFDNDCEKVAEGHETDGEFTNENNIINDDTDENGEKVVEVHETDYEFMDDNYTNNNDIDDSSEKMEEVETDSEDRNSTDDLGDDNSENRYENDYEKENDDPEYDSRKSKTHCENDDFDNTYDDRSSVNDFENETSDNKYDSRNSDNYFEDDKCDSEYGDENSENDFEDETFDIECNSINSENDLEDENVDPEYSDENFESDFDDEKFDSEHSSRNSENDFEDENFDNECDCRTSENDFEDENVDPEYSDENSENDFDNEKFDSEHSSRNSENDFEDENFDNECDSRTSENDFEDENVDPEYSNENSENDFDEETFDNEDSSNNSENSFEDECFDTELSYGSRNSENEFEAENFDNECNSRTSENDFEDENVDPEYSDENSENDFDEEKFDNEDSSNNSENSFDDECFDTELSNDSRNSENDFEDENFDPEYVDESSENYFEDENFDSEYVDENSENDFEDENFDPEYVDENSENDFEDENFDSEYVNENSENDFEGETSDPEYVDENSENDFEDETFDPEYIDGNSENDFEDETSDSKYVDENSENDFEDQNFDPECLDGNSENDFEDETSDPEYVDENSENDFEDENFDSEYVDENSENDFEGETSDPEYVDENSENDFEDETFDPEYIDGNSENDFEDETSDSKYVDENSENDFEDQNFDPECLDGNSENDFEDETSDPEYVDENSENDFEDENFDPEYVDENSENDFEDENFDNEYGDENSETDIEDEYFDPEKNDETSENGFEDENVDNEYDSSNYDNELEDQNFDKQYGDESSENDSDNENFDNEYDSRKSENDFEDESFDNEYGDGKNENEYDDENYEDEYGDGNYENQYDNENNENEYGDENYETGYCDENYETGYCDENYETGYCDENYETGYEDEYSDNEYDDGTSEDDYDD